MSRGRVLENGITLMPLELLITFRCEEYTIERRFRLHIFLSTNNFCEETEFQYYKCHV